MILGKVLLLAVAAVSVSVATPPPGHVPTHDNGKDAPKYDYGYDVNDGDGGRQGHVESRDGVHAQGSYYVQLPHSGQQVQYSADDWGYHPLVTYGSRTKGAVTNTHIALGSEAVAALAALRGPAASSPSTAEGQAKSAAPGRLVITELRPSPSPHNAPPAANGVTSSSLRSGHAQRLAASIALDGDLPHVDVVPGRVRYLVKSLDNDVLAQPDQSPTPVETTIHGAQALPLTQAQSDVADDALFGAKLNVVSNSIAEAVTPLRPIVVADFAEDNAVTAAPPVTLTTASPVYNHASTSRTPSTPIFTTARPILAQPTTPAYPSSTPSFQSSTSSYLPSTPDYEASHVDVGEYGVPTATPATVVITPRPPIFAAVDDDAGHQVAMRFVKERFKTSTIVEVQRAVPIEFEPVATAHGDDGVPEEVIRQVVDAAEGVGRPGGGERQQQRVYPVYSQAADEGRDQQAEQQVEQQVLNAQLVQQFNEQQAQQQVYKQQQAEQQVYKQQQAEQEVYNGHHGVHQQDVFIEQQAEQQASNDQQIQQQVFNDQQVQQQEFNDQKVLEQIYNEQQAQQQANHQQAQQQVFNNQQAQQQEFNDQKVLEQIYNEQQAQQQVLTNQQAQQQAYSDGIEQQVLKDQQAEQQVHNAQHLDQQVFNDQQVAQQVFTDQQVELQVLPKSPQHVSEDSTQIIGLLPPISILPSNPTPLHDQQVRAEIAKLKQSHAFLVANHQVQEIAASRPSYVPVGDAQLVQANHERELYRNQLLQAHSANQQLRQEHAALIAQAQPEVVQEVVELRLNDQFLVNNQNLLRGEQVQQQLTINADRLQQQLSLDAARLQQQFSPDAARQQQQQQQQQQQATAGAVRAQQPGAATPSLLKAENSVATPLSAAYTAQLQANAIRRPTSAALHQQAVNTAHQNTLRFKTQAQTDKHADTENDYNQQLVEESKQDDIATDRPRLGADVTHLRTLLRAEQAPVGGDVVGLTPPVVATQEAVAPVAIQVPVAIYQQPPIKQAVRLQFAQPTQLFPQFYQQHPRFPLEHAKPVNRPRPVAVTKLVAVDRPWQQLPFPVASTATSAHQYFHYNTAAHKHVRAHSGFVNGVVPRNPRFQTAAAHAYRAPPTRHGGHPKLADFQPSQPEFFKPGRGVDHQELHRFHGRTKKLNIEYGFKPPLIPSQQILDDPQPEPEPVND